ncbi:hypothetical protein JRC49_09655 [Clostridiales bacterium FE2011]|nr:hypothetical protein JRC49_09655 [Clostridiales bacterium FE2011]
MNYELTKHYFKVVDDHVDETLNYKPSLIMGGIGLILLLAVKSFGGTILGLGLIALGVYYIIHQKSQIQEKKDKIQKEIEAIPTDEQYDGEVLKSLNNLREKALSKLGIDEEEVSEIEPISFDGYVYRGATELKKGKDGLFRTNKYECVQLFFSQNEVHCYTYNFDTITDKHFESTDVYFYRDIVAVSTSSEVEKVLEQNVEYETFKLTTAGGTALQVSLRDVNNAQRSINAMRSLLRQKKSM